MYAWIGTIVAGMLAGSFVIPSKKIKRLQWDQTWLVYCVVALVLLPLLAVFVVSPGLYSASIGRNPGVALKVMACGAGWGLGAFLYALSIARIGFSMANAIVCGAVILIGSVSPLFVGGAKLGEGEIGRLILGLSLLVLGIALCAVASIMRDRHKEAAGTAKTSLGAAVAGVMVALLSGIFSALLNTGFAYGGILITDAVAAGFSPVQASLAVWLPALLGGFAVNLLATARKITKAQGWGLFQGAPTQDWVRALSLGLIWFSASMLYGICTTALGSAGTVYGWAVYMGVAILTSTFWGFVTGEWRNAGLAPRLVMVTGVALFIVAFVTIAGQSK